MPANPLASGTADEVRVTGNMTMSHNVQRGRYLSNSTHIDVYPFRGPLGKLHNSERRASLKATNVLHHSAFGILAVCIARQSDNCGTEAQDSRGQQSSEDVLWALVGPNCRNTCNRLID